MAGNPSRKQPKHTLAECLKLARGNQRDLIATLRNKDSELANEIRESRDHWLNLARDRYIEMRRG